MIQKTITFNIFVRMHANQISREKLLEKTGITKRRFYMSTSGNQKWDYEDMQKIADALGCKFESLLVEIPANYLSGAK